MCHQHELGHLLAGSDRDVAQGAHGNRQPPAGMKKPLGGNIALWRTTFSAASVRFRVIFSPSI